MLDWISFYVGALLFQGIYLYGTRANRTPLNFVAGIAWVLWLATMLAFGTTLANLVGMGDKVPRFVFVLIVFIIPVAIAVNFLKKWKARLDSEVTIA